MNYVFAAVLEVGKSIELWYCDAPCCQGQRLHRDGGPAVTYPSGVEEWWFHGERAPAEQVRFREGERAAAAMRQPLSEPAAVFKQPIRIKTSSADEREPGEG